MSVYTWGLHPFIKVDRGVAKILVPKKLKLRKGIVPRAVASCTHCFFLLSDAGDVYSWGSGKAGRLGQGNENDVDEPKKIRGLPTIREVFGASWNVGVIANNNDIFIWGNLLKTSSPTQLEGVKANKVSFGYQHCMILTTEGKILTMGNNSNLQCGIRGGGKISKPKMIMPDVTFTDICCGAKNGYAISTDGRVFGWGPNDWGQLGRGKKDGVSRLPKTLRLPQLQEDERYVSVHGSLSDKYCHVALRTSAGRIVMFGSNYKGKLATGNTEDRFTPFMCGNGLLNISKFMPGGIHNYALRNDGALLTFGCGSDGRLGHPECEGSRYLYKEYIPRVVDRLTRMDGVRRVRDASSSYYAGICITD